MPRIESFLSARLFVVPQLVEDRIYFLSNLSGHLSLYAMDYGGSVPEPLLPPNIALQNPHLIGGYSFKVYPKIGKILVMIDRDGDENYQPMLIPMDGGFPEPAFGTHFDNYRVSVANPDADKNLIYIAAQSRSEACTETYMGNVATGELTKLGEGVWGYFPFTSNDEHTKVILGEGYTTGDVVLYSWDKEVGEPRLLFGKPLDQRAEGESVTLSGIGSGELTEDSAGLVVVTTLFDDTGSLGYIDLADPAEIQPVTLKGMKHEGIGELTGIEHIDGDTFLVGFNIDGCSWGYEATFDQSARTMTLNHVLVGEGELLSSGVLESNSYDKESDRYILSFSTAVSPTQIYTIEGEDRSKLVRHTHERILGIPGDQVSSGEDASFTSFDGLRVSARLYLPAESLGFNAPYPVVYYIHGGPQGQERPDFAWFSMPLIQYLTLRGFAVFVPNVRGSTGYGLEYTKKVDRDWGGDDRLDHVHAMTKVLPNDKRLDVSRAGVVGRSYGGYMTLTLAARHPELWAAACDMFGPYDLFTFMDRIPETWKPYFHIAVGHPEKDRDMLVDRSPRTHMEQITAPLMVIQGKNDPRVVEQESRDLVEYLRGIGKEVDYLMFEDEGHDVLKYENRVRCYNTITDFFAKHLNP